MGACVCSERSAYFDPKSVKEHRTDMLIKYLRPKSNLTVKHQAYSGEEADEESGTEGTFSDGEAPAVHQSEIYEREEEAKSPCEPPLMSNLFFPETPPSPAKASDEGIFIEESPPLAMQPPLTQLSLDPEDSCNPASSEEPQSFVLMSSSAKPEVIVINSTFITLWPRRRLIIKPEQHDEVAKWRPEFEDWREFGRPASEESCMEPIFQELVDEDEVSAYSGGAALFCYPHSGKRNAAAIYNAPLKTFDSGDSSPRNTPHTHALRMPAPLLSPDLRLKNQRGSLTREEEMLSLTARHSVI